MRIRRADILEQVTAIRSAMSAAGSMLTDTQALSVTALFAPWDQAGSYAIGDKVRYGENLFRCAQAHSAQADWKPDVVPALWVRIDDPAIEFPAWRQPAGGHDAYAMDSKVSHGGKHWKSTANANVWEPGVYGWVEVV